MYDKVETHVRGLKLSGVESSSYGALLNPVLQKKLPPELRLIVNRRLSESWDLDEFMKTLSEEPEVRERSAASSKSEALKAVVVVEGKTTTPLLLY
jgi:hypothetical protein